MDKFLWGTCFYLGPVHIFRTLDAFTLSSLINVGHKLVHFQSCSLFSLRYGEATSHGEGRLQKNPEYMIKSELKDKTLNCPKEIPGRIGGGGGK